jgi:2-methylisocitrate lyase-like PEP mutase family enzyme
VRLQALEAAGADVLYAPGLATPAEIRAMCEAASKPVNVLARPALSLAQIVDARDRGDFSSLGSPPEREWLA